MKRFPSGWVSKVEKRVERFEHEAEVEAEREWERFCFRVRVLGWVGGFTIVLMVGLHFGGDAIRNAFGG